jgi:hypothetical protein
MGLKAVIGKLEEVAESVRALYKPQGDKFVLDLEGDVPGFVAEKDHIAVKTSLTEFRDNNIKILKDHDALKELFKDIDPAKAREALGEIEKLKGKGVGKTDDLQKLIDAAVAPLTDKIATLTTSLAEKDVAASKAALRSKLTDALVAAGVKRAAIPDALSRADAKAFKLDGDRLIEMNGDTPRFSDKNPGKPREAAEWIAELAAGDGAHLFEPSKGGGASGDAGKPGSEVAAVPFDTKSFLANIDKIAGGEVKVNAGF